jgi:chromosome segregation ATPase
MSTEIMDDLGLLSGNAMRPTSRDVQDVQKNIASSDPTLQEPLDSLSIELTRISAEIQSINSGFQLQMQHALAEARAAIQEEYRNRFEQSMEVLREQLRSTITEEVRQEFEATLQQKTAYVTEVQTEMERVNQKLEAIVREIAAMLDDPSIELSRVIRKRTEQSELNAYLNGLRFSLGENKLKAAGA